jgi:CxxC motif-containing protein
MRVLAKVKPKPPVSLGHVIVPNILDTGADIVAETDFLG